MIEVEGKARISDIGLVRSRAKEFAKYIGRRLKVDDYYTLQERGYPEKSLRIRKFGGFYMVNFKRRISFKKGIHAKNEVEFKVSNIQGFLRLIKDFGYRKWLTKKKRSEIYELEKNFHIELNNVKSLGWFLEIEYLTNDGRIGNARRKVFKTFKKFGIKMNELIKEGYTKMLWDKKKG